jgi:ABC-type lipoprotein export system ATPase subunit
VRGLAPDDDLVDRWLDALGLTGLRHREVAALSGGERARVAVARALVAGRPLVLLDEPTAQLDEANAERLAAALVDAARAGAAVVVATHDPVVVAAADDAVPVG